MNCYFPGRVIVGPGPEWRAEAASQIRERIGAEFDIESALSDVFQANELPIPDNDDWRTHHFPFLARVPEGSEERVAQFLYDRYSPTGQINAACPDYAVRPNANLNINARVISEAISRVGASVVGPQCGSNCTVGIIDSGLDVHYLPYPAAVNHFLLDSKDPMNPQTRLSDTTGHGTLVARIINEIAPAARIISVKAFDTTGTLSEVLAAMYLAHAAGPCDVINLSLSLSCNPTACNVCGSPQNAAMNLPQLQYFFRNFQNLAADSTIVVASGNNTTRITCPAVFDGMLAVGSCHFQTHDPISRYASVPKDRFLLAPDGTSTPNEELGTRPTGYRSTVPMHGTSFAAAFATGIVARMVCGLKGGPCCPPGQAGFFQQTPGQPLRAAVLSKLTNTADRNWTGYDVNRHGLGRVRLN